MNIEIMSNGLVLAAIRIALAMILLFFSYRAADHLIKGLRESGRGNTEIAEKHRKSAIRFGILFAIAMASVVWGSSLSPKSSLVVPSAMQVERPEVSTEIVPAPPRTEKLDGFKPLGAD